MSPRDPFKGIFFATISAAHYFAGRYLQAVEWARKAVEMRPGNLGGWRILCASLAQAGEMEESRTVMRTLRQLQPGLSIAWIKQWVPYTSGPMTHFLEGMRKAGLTG
jgi:adenylate cyclase